MSFPADKPLPTTMQAPALISADTRLSFPADKPLPATLARKPVKARIAENEN